MSDVKELQAQRAALQQAIRRLDAEIGQRPYQVGDLVVATSRWTRREHAGYVWRIMDGNHILIRIELDGESVLLERRPRDGAYDNLRRA
jgi:hypothetical protein